VLVQADAPPDELAKVCEGLLKCKNSARNRLFMAKALISQNKLREATTEIQKAIEIEPGNILPYLFAGAVSLKLSDDEAYLTNASDQLTRAKELYEKMPAGEEQRKRWRELVLDGAILDALADEPLEAKKNLDTVLEQFPDDQAAKEILSAVE
jgi:hypothetical protein